MILICLLAITLSASRRCQQFKTTHNLKFMGNRRLYLIAKSELLFGELLYL